MLFFKWPPYVEESVSRSTWISAWALYLLTSVSGCLDHPWQTGACGLVSGVYVVVDLIITRSRLSTSTLKPEIMGTSMTAILDEPE